MLPPMSDDQRPPADADAEADRLLSGGPDDAARSRLHRQRRVPAVLGVAVFGALLLLPVVVLVDDGGSSAEPPLWQAVAGFALMTLGIVVSLVSVTRTLRGLRRRRDRGTPLLARTAGRQVELRAQVRGQAPVDPARTALARRLAEEMVHQRLLVGNSVGLTFLWVGQAMAFPAWWRVGIAVAFAVLMTVSGAGLTRDARSARAFLAAHPD
ncbi:hypothetical protein SAMN05428965_2837 [Geodermatophilus sp. DSM 45219]|nr:hypothetical protein SAMN05428965_2837 [Geodermatophilus sp. DSM 45219]